jgi:hypothetical protein
VPLNNEEKRHLAQQKTLSIPSEFKQRGSGRLRPAKFISFNDFTVPVPSALFKSPPTSSAFFTIYNTTKSSLEYHAYCENINRYITDVFAVYMGHTASCVVRVPVDVTKQYARMPAYTNLNVFQTVNKMLSTRGLGEQLLRHLVTTVVREIPFCSLKFPLWEFFYVTVESQKAKLNKNMQPHESAIVGSIAGGIAAAITTPIDVAFKSIKVDNVILTFLLFLTCFLVVLVFHLLIYLKKGRQYKRFKLAFVMRDIARDPGLKG